LKKKIDESYENANLKNKLRFVNIIHNLKELFSNIDQPFVEKDIKSELKKIIEVN